MKYRNVVGQTFGPDGTDNAEFALKDLNNLSLTIEKDRAVALEMAGNGKTVTPPFDL